MYVFDAREREMWGRAPEKAAAAASPAPVPFFQQFLSKSRSVFESLPPTTWIFVLNMSFLVFLLIIFNARLNKIEKLLSKMK